MLIKIDMYWINPNNIAAIYDTKTRTIDGGKTHLPDCQIDLLGQHSDSGGLWISDRTSDEVAAEINKQLKG